MMTPLSSSPASGRAAPSPSPSPSSTRTFYRRELPSTSISFSSPRGKAVFASAMANGGTYSFFPLIEQLQTQSEPAYCGLTTLVIVLNALAVDPRRSWKGPWRWYEESMLNCCVDLEKVKKKGITFSTFNCLAKCQGLNVKAVYGTETDLDAFRDAVKQTCTEQPGTQMRPTSFMVVSYNRKVFEQTGTGHFSPIGAYDEASDQLLVLDTARFKYGPHWVSCAKMYEALQSIDPDTGKSRGYAIIGDGRCSECKKTRIGTYMSHLPSVLFRSSSEESHNYLRREYKTYLATVPKGHLNLASVVSFWSKKANRNVWELVEPQLRPVDQDEIIIVESIKTLLKSLLESDVHAKNIPPAMTMFTSSISSDCPGGECCNDPSRANARVLDISAMELVYIIYLASLPVDKRQEIVFRAQLERPVQVEVDDITRAQLLAEASLISFAIETSDDFDR